MKTEKYYCDKCGEEVKELISIYKYLGVISTFLVELCPTCFAEMFKFIKEK